MYELPGERTVAFRRAAAWIATVGIAHFLLGTHTHAVHGLHVLLAGLFLVPVLVAAQAGGVRAGLVAATVVSLTYGAHLFWSWRASPLANLDQYGMIGVYFVVAVAAGHLAEEANWRRQQRDEVIRRAAEAERAFRDPRP